MLNTTSLSNKSTGLSNELNDGYVPNRNPRDNFPEHTRGKIMEWRKNPENESKRRTEHQRVMGQNSFNYKHGKYSFYRPIPKYTLKYIEYIDEMDLNDIQELRETVEELIKSNLTRVEMGKIFELYDGGVQDKSLSRLMKETVYLIFLYHQVFNMGGAIQDQA